MNTTEKKITSFMALVGDWLNATSKDKAVEKTDRLTIEGEVFDGLAGVIDNFLKGREELNVQNFIPIWFDDSNVSSSNLEDFKKDGKYVFKKWRLSINKTAFLENLPKEEYSYLFFYTKEALINWLETVDPLNIEETVHRLSPLRVIVNGLGKNCGGQKLQFLDNGTVSEVPPFGQTNASLPSREKIREEVHIIANGVEIAPQNLQIELFSGNEALDRILTKNYLLAMAACLVQEFYSPKKVILKGYKQVELLLTQDGDSFPTQLVKELGEAVHWVYEERVSTRMQLLSDRLSLEIPSGTSLLEGLKSHLAGALKQAKEQYKFVIHERMDAYYREKRSLLNELQGQSKAYSEKLRSLLNGLIRDVLAAIFLVGFGLFSKANLNELEKLLGNDQVGLLFKGLGIYFIISFVLQFIINLTDLHIAKKELVHWIGTTRNYLSKQEVKDIIETSTKDRRINFWCLNLLIALAYAGIILFCWKIDKLLTWF